ncbi:MAG: 3-hydroxybutyrate dehydrogenase [Rhizobiaceae bacterium]|jgi:3-hydroxybutyrate dehydrogenase|nr:3-hydroxybutyrate dehydrogenase [Rhizobiaceae bacterium]
MQAQTALITGSTSGIGLGIAEALAASGRAVALNGRSDTPENHALASAMSARHGVAVVYLAADISEGDLARALVARAADALGRLDILVNNAGVQHVAPVEEFPVAKWDHILALNLSSAFHTSAAAIPLMKANGFGRIINVSSAHGLTASPYKSAYVSAKHGLVGLTKTVALEMAETRLDLTCNAICPGYVLTPLVENQIADQMKVHKMSREEVLEKVMLQRQPTRKMASVEDLGALAVFLASPAASQITGAALPVDGGWTAL